MIRELNAYEQFVVDVLENVHFVGTHTLVTSLINYFPRLYPKNAYLYIHSCQRLGYIITSADGWCISKCHYHQMRPEDKDLSSIDSFRNNSIESIDGLHVSKTDRNIADCMMVVADMMPLSEDYILSPSPWYVSFVAKSELDPKGRLFQITTFREGEEEAMGELLISGYNFTDEEFRKQVRRIAILDDPKKTKAVPKLGFANLCVIDFDKPNGLEIVEKRTPEERWNDLR